MNSNKIENRSDYGGIDLKELFAHWKEAIECHYSKNVISEVKIDDTRIDIILQWSHKEHKTYKLGCRMELYKRMEDYEKTFIRYGIHKVDNGSVN